MSIPMALSPFRIDCRSDESKTAVHRRGYGVAIAITHTKLKPACQEPVDGFKTDSVIIIGLGNEPDLKCHRK